MALLDEGTIVYSNMILKPSVKSFSHTDMLLLQITNCKVCLKHTLWETVVF